MTLDDIARKHGTDKSSDYHNYIPTYEKWLSNRRINKLLEIGFGKGASARMWLEYLPEAEIYCIEYGGDEFEQKWQKPEVDVPRLNFRFGDSTNEGTWKNISADFDVVVDDGSHDPNDQIATFLLAFPKVKSGGLYFLEDTHCGFQEKYQKKYGDQEILYHWFFNRIIAQQTPGVAVGGDFYNSRPHIKGVAKDILSYHFYKSMIVFEKA